MIELKDNTNILFIGDSITSCGRNLYMPLGFGFPCIATGILQAKFPEKNINGISRGVGGNKLCDLAKRWNSDCLDLNPDLIIILMGINDVLSRFFPGGEIIKPEDVKRDYLSLLDTVKDKKVVILEPFLLINSNKWTNPWQIEESWIIEGLNPTREVIREVAKERNCYFIPLYDIFKDLADKYGTDKWTCEGCHPTTAGHGVIAKEIVKLFGVNL